MMPANEEFPSLGAYRGIASETLFVDNNRTQVKSDVFKFDEIDGRTDGMVECSVNWADDEGALRCIARQTTDRRGARELQFAGGACRISLEDLQYLRKVYGRLLDWERRPTSDGDGSNPYHGNLLSLSGAKGDSKAMMREMRSQLALLASRTELVTRDELDRLM